MSLIHIEIKDKRKIQNKQKIKDKRCTTRYLNSEDNDDDGDAGSVARSIVGEMQKN